MNEVRDPMPGPHRRLLGGKAAQAGAFAGQCRSYQQVGGLFQTKCVGRLIPSLVLRG